MHSEVIQSPRVMAYGPTAVMELERAGIAEECHIGMGEPPNTGRLVQSTLARAPSKPGNFQALILV